MLIYIRVMCCTILSVISLGDIVVFLFFFFFKQKTAYEILTCDWSSDVCSSDLDMSVSGTKLIPNTAHNFNTTDIISCFAVLSGSSK